MLRNIRFIVPKAKKKKPDRQFQISEFFDKNLIGKCYICFEINSLFF